ncbi:MAG TPA: hypothetical protein VKY38_02555 [Azoarcus sp.]|nr:hypothetical protein [Azoarcus sp.]
MLTRISLGLVAALMLLLSGCASFQTGHQFASEAELLDTRGQPTRVWDNEDGTRTFEYSTQPHGGTCWMYTVDADGVIVEQHDALSEANRARVQVGMTKNEVTRLLGQHRSVQFFDLKNEEVWDWTLPTEIGFAGSYFNVHFVNDVVARTSASTKHFGNGEMGWHGGGWGGSGGSGWGLGVGMHRGGFGWGSPGWFGGWGW